MIYFYLLYLIITCTNNLKTLSWRSLVTSWGFHAETSVSEEMCKHLCVQMHRLIFWANCSLKTVSMHTSTVLTYSASAWGYLRSSCFKQMMIGWAGKDFRITAVWPTWNWRKEAKAHIIYSLFLNIFFIRFIFRDFCVWSSYVLAS